MDQMAVYYKSMTTTIVAVAGSKTVPLRDSGINAKQCTAVLAVPADGTKLPPFIILKGTNLSVCSTV